VGETIVVVVVVVLGGEEQDAEEHAVGEDSFGRWERRSKVSRGRETTFGTPAAAQERKDDTRERVVVVVVR
jgi:hypothetical protein